MKTARIVAVFALAAAHDHQVRKLPRIGHPLAPRCRNKIQEGGTP